VTTEAGYVTVWLVCAGLVITVAGLALRLDAPASPRPARRIAAGDRLG
jgi:hypothetical protein